MEENRVEKINSEYKELCQVYTPINIVKMMLDYVDYKKEIYGKKVIENSCGDGHILVQIVERYIQDGLKNRIAKCKIKEGLEQDIYAFEIDEEQYEKCIKNLNEKAKEYNIDNVNWKNVKLGDALKRKNDIKYNYVIGNPPYIKYKSLKKDDRIFVKENFKTCKKGKFDYCYAFIEKSIDILDNEGKMAYLIPSSIFKNVFAEDLRNFIKPHLIEIYDFTKENLFKEDIDGNPKVRLTSSCIMIIQKESNKKYITYYDVINNKKIKIDKSKLLNKWIFEKRKQEGNNKYKRRFGDYFKASNTIATLYNKAYVINAEEKIKEDKNYIYLRGGTKLEKKIIKPASSPRGLQRKVKETIIFPYRYEGEKLIKYTNEEFENSFPCISEYLKNKYGKALKNRKSDKNAKWFEYGRSQALDNLNKDKLLLSTVVTKEVNIYKLDKKNIPYSGIYIQPIGNEMNLEDATRILQSKEFFKYIEKIGIHASGDSYRITSKDINNYEF